MNNPKPGTTAKCVQCGDKIMFGVSHWEHVGKRPRHPARPKLGTVKSPEQLTNEAAQAGFGPQSHSYPEQTSASSPQEGGSAEPNEPDPDQQVQ